MINGEWEENGLGYSSVVHSVRLDENGNDLGSYVTHPPQRAAYVGGSNTGGLLSDGSGFYSAGSTLDTNEINRPSLIFWDNDAVPSSTVEYELNNSAIGRQAKHTPEGGFVICGELNADGVQSDAFLIKTDALGNEEWTATYGTANSYDYFVSVDTVPGGGYYLGGQRGSGSSNIDQWVMRVDSDGQEIWSYNYGTPGGGDGLAQVTTLSNGDCVFGSSWQTGSQYQLQACMVRLDLQGEIVWSKRYGPVGNVVMHSVQELEPSHDLIVCGALGTGINYFGTLLRTTSTGDSLWMRSYQYYDDLVTNGRGIFRDVVPTPDGGFIACGSALPVTAADTLLYTQDVWVVKTDSFGCIEPGCQLITGVETQITNLMDVLRVWPNPVQSGSVVSFSLELPTGFVPVGNSRLTVVGSDGRLVHEQRVTSSNSLQLNADLSPGLYHIHLSDATRWISGTKLVVE